MQLELHDRVALDTFSLKMKKGVKDECAFLRGLLDDLIKTSRVGTIEISPAMAAIMLERNTGNRALSKTRVLRYAKDMKDGKWKLTGEPIIFSKSGILNDGQTRLHACVEAGVSFMTDVRFGIERDAFNVTGCGAKRTLADVFSIMGKGNPTKLSGALNWLNGYRIGFGASRLSHTEGLALLDADPDIERSVGPGAHLYHMTRWMEPSLAIFLHYIFSLKDADQADAFFAFLSDGIGMVDPKDARHVIRQKLINNKAATGKLPPLDIAALVIKAWNCHRSGKSTRALKWVNNPPAGTTPEPFPRAV